MTCRGVSIRGGGDRRRQSRQWRRMGVGYPRYCPGRIAQRESARFTRGRSLVRSQVRPFPIDFDRSPWQSPRWGGQGDSVRTLPQSSLPQSQPGDGGELSLALQRPQAHPAVDFIYGRKVQESCGEFA